MTGTSPHVKSATMIRPVTKRLASSVRRARFPLPAFRIPMRALRSLVIIGAVACTPKDESRVARGRGLEIESLPAAEQAQVYTAAVRSAFDVGPGLVLLVHPRLLPREAGQAGGDSVPADVVRALRQAGTIAGTCEPQRADRAALPRCDATSAGYVVRFSDVLRVATDTVQVYLDAEQYTVPGAPPQQVFQFEKAYQLVRQQGRWRVVREGRVPQAVIGARE